MENYKRRLELQKQEGLYRNPPEIEKREGKHVVFKGERLLSFASNDYLGLGASRGLAETVGRHFKEGSSSASSSRLVSGNYAGIGYAEKAYADYFGYESAVFFPSGYQANLAVISTLLGAEDTIFFDKHVHASCVKGMAVSKAVLKGYKHASLTHLQNRLKRYSREVDKDGEFRVRAAVLTESLFSMDGDLLDTGEFGSLKKEAGFLSIVDEAHAFGALGSGGRGIAAGVADVALGTFGKALGLFGAFVLLPEILREYLFNFASPLIYTTTLPEAHAASAVDILGMIQGAGEQRSHLRNVSGLMKAVLVENGFTVHGDAHILSVAIGDEALAHDISHELLNHGVLAFSARYPTVQAGKAILRLSMTASHDADDVTFLVDALKKAAVVCGWIKRQCMGKGGQDNGDS